MLHAISHKFKPVELLRFALPSIFMMLFLSLYTIIDGFYIAHYVGTDAFAAVSLAYPYSAVIFSIAFMFGTGGSASVANLLGEGKKLEACQAFSLIVLVTMLSIGIIGIASYVFIDQLIPFLGASIELLPDVKIYLSLLILSSVPAALQVIFISFFVTASKPNLGLIFTVIAGISNIALDYIFIVKLNFGVKGAALATGLAYCIPAVGGIVFFIRRENGLSFSKPKLNLAELKSSCSNGSSEMINNLSSCIITFIFNITMMGYAGSSGVAAISVVLYCEFLYTAIFIGFSVGVAPIFSYHYGARNTVYFNKLLHTCLLFIGIAAILMFIATYFSSESITSMFAKSGSKVFDLTSTGLKIFSFSVLFSGINIFASATLTATTKGKPSAIISIARTLVFIIVGLYLFIYLFDITGVWLSIPFAETITIVIVIYYYYHFKRNSKYIK